MPITRKERYEKQAQHGKEAIACLRDAQYELEKAGLPGLEEIGDDVENVITSVEDFLKRRPLLLTKLPDDDDLVCLAESEPGEWVCSLKKRHRGDHEAWALDDGPEGDELMNTWPRKKRPKRKT